jgi:hypothetical protein
MTIQLACPRCGTPVPRAEWRCPSCGAPLTAATAQLRMAIDYRSTSESGCRTQAAADARRFRSRGFEPISQTSANEPGGWVLTVQYRSLPDDDSKRRSLARRYARSSLARPVIAGAVVLLFLIGSSLLTDGRLAWWEYTIGLCCLPIIGWLMRERTSEDR